MRSSGTVRNGEIGLSIGFSANSSYLVEGEDYFIDDDDDDDDKRWNGGIKGILTHSFSM